MLLLLRIHWPFCGCLPSLPPPLSPLYQLVECTLTLLRTYIGCKSRQFSEFSEKPLTAINKKENNWKWNQIEVVLYNAVRLFHNFNNFITLLLFSILVVLQNKQIINNTNFVMCWFCYKMLFTCAEFELWQISWKTKKWKLHMKKKLSFIYSYKQKCFS